MQSAGFYPGYVTHLLGSSSFVARGGEWIDKLAISNGPVNSVGSDLGALSIVCLERFGAPPPWQMICNSQGNCKETVLHHAAL